MVEEVKHFMCFKHELERINEGLILRGTDASSVINITDNGDEVVVWYKFKNKQDMKQTAVKDLAYYKANAEEDYLAVPISVLRYISQLEQEQDKKLYSEEEVENILIEYVKTNPSKPYRVISWFEQFKKK
jgi:hypothetical protein